MDASLILSIIFYLLLLDALIANLLAWFGMQHWWKHFSSFAASHFPLARGWTGYYLLLVLLLGYSLITGHLLQLP